MSNTDSFAIVHFPQNPKISAEDLVDIQFNATNTSIKTADITYEGPATKSSELCGILGFVDDQGHIHLSSNFALYSMRPKLTDFNTETKPTSNTEDTKLNRTDLDEKFGTEKKRRSVHSKKRNTIEVSVLATAVSAAREQVLNTTTNEHLNESLFNNSIVSFNDDDQLALPAPNYDAKKPEEVFVFDDILNENDMLLLNDKCSQIVDGTKEDIQKWAKEGTYASFVCDQMKKLPVDHAERIKAASKILYLHYLIAFFKRSMFKRLSGKPFPDDAPRALQDKALQVYAIANINERTRKEVNTVPPRLRLKLTAHICILSLYICRFTVDVDSLRLSLGSSISILKLQDIFSELGCKIIKVAHTNVATLETPINKPKLKDGMSLGSNRKRKRTN
ncbi:unnamed protein product [Rotaria magnacalcarata]|uniref:DNA-directed RNA polymerase I subunit RPA49 n=3 Tax=Rotaria magnacalcarata TaxID=392030 RepID=A0A815SSQ6_9BILA|nr:unnamed protein product [Rotaria magnacalcarata]CAF1534255.1 unnamed protein product [Rotaria magnacalcarata]CAF2007305.1 unnamed protein product [Rotaria magnacalcarata]CAF2126122.1 unnamed protein product [Rotaria magnacalcarata]CAF4114139.1 unnamed protein product [Rotaria magnacalcarata]